MARHKKTIDEKYNQVFAIRFRELMGSTQTNQTELAQAIGKSRQVVSQYYNGESEPPFDTLTKIADYFKVSTDYLLNKTNDPNPNPSSVDELGLSAKAVKQIKAISTHNHATEMLGSLNMILEDPYLFKLLLEVNTVAEAVRNEIAHLQSRPSKVTDDPLAGLGMLGLLLEDQITSREIESEIIAAHPELAGRITIDCGEYSLERRIDELGSSFTSLVKYATGYHELDSLRIEWGM